MKSAHIESFFTESLPIQFKQGKTRTSKKFIFGHFLPSPLMFSVATFFCFDYCSVGDHSIHWVVNPLSANITKWSNCLSVFDHFVGLALKELKSKIKYLVKLKFMQCCFTFFGTSKDFMKSFTIVMVLQKFVFKSLITLKEMCFH